MLNDGNKEHDSFWEDPKVVARFANRPPDHRLVALVNREGEYGAVHDVWAPPSPIKALDIGTGGGRNAVWLARQGAMVWGLDASTAMVNETRRRLQEVTGGPDADERVRVGEMRDLSAHDDGVFDLVVALGVLQDARSRPEWESALSEVARVLRPGGLTLVANFGPDSQPAGVPLTPVNGERDVWLGFGPASRRMVLPDLAGLDADFAHVGLEPALPTQRVRVATERGHRFTLNALYKKAL